MRFPALIIAALLPAVATAKTVTFASPASIPGGSNGAGSSEAGDLDLDGRQEFITADESSLKIYDLDPNTGDFTVIDLLPNGTTRLDRFGGDLTTADINADGFPDIIVPDSKNGGNNGSLSWFENPAGNLSDTWTEHVIDTWSGTGTGNQIAHMSEVDAGDINGDGKIDIVTRDISHGVFVLLQETAGPAGSAWENRRFIPTNPREGLDLFNPDGDADLDIILNGVWLETPANPLTGTYTLHTYGAAWYPPGNSNAEIRDYACQIAVADFNGDTRDDIAISNSEELSNAGTTTSKPLGIQIYLAPADPKTQPWTQVIPETQHFSWHSLEPADLDCDGSPDFIAAISTVGADNAPAQISKFINDGTGTSFTKTALVPGFATALYNATLADADGDGDADLLSPSNFNTGPIRYFENTTEVPTTPPATPQNLVATPTSQSSITLTWTDASINEAAFEIERMESGTSFTLVSTTGANATTYQDTGLNPATTYTYRVRATNAAGESTYSTNSSATTPAPDTQAPTAPTLVANTASAFQIDLSWSGATDDVAVNTYNVFLGSTLLAQVTDTTYSATGLQPETTYSFAVTALDSAANESSASNTESATTSPAPDLSDCLVAYWPLDGTPVDALGNYPATLTGAPTFTTNGQIEGALDFSDDTHHATTAPFDLPTTNTGITLAAWVNLRSFDGNAQEARFISKASGTNGNDHNWMLGNNGGTSLRFRLKTSTSSATTTYIVDNVLSTNTWTHLAATYDGSFMRLFVNGNQVGAPLAKTGTITAAPTVPIGIGNQPQGSGDRALDGLIDDVRIYSKALTPTELTAIIAPPIPAELLSITFDETTATFTSTPEGILPPFQFSPDLTNWNTITDITITTPQGSTVTTFEIDLPTGNRNFFRFQNP